MPSEFQLAELAHRLRELTAGTSEREAYLERLATEIREGRYDVDANTLAEKLLERLDFSDEPTSDPGSAP